MKNIVLICLTLISVNLKAQCFGTPGSVWWVGYTSLSGYGRIKYYDVADTTVNNKTYKHFKTSAYFYGVGEQANWFYTPPSPIFRASGDTVLLLEGGIEYPQYIFSADSGDTWVCGPIANQYCNCTIDSIAPYIKVEAKFDTIINNQTLRAMRLRKYTCSPNYNSSLVIEKIGSLSNHLFPLLWANVDTCSIGFYDDATFNRECFSSDMFPLSSSQTISCDGVLPIPELGANLLTIFPNPASNVIQVNGLNNKPFSYQLYNNTGQQVAYNTKQQLNTIDVSALPQGLYLLNLWLPNGYSQTYKVVKN